MAVSSVSFPTPQAFSEANIDWSPLANLGKVYQEQQDRNRKLAALAQLGSDPNANATALIQSGDPTLAVQGINLQDRLRTQAESKREFEAQQKIREDVNRRAQEAADKQDEDEAAAAKAIASIYGPTPTTAPTQQPDPAFTQGAPPIANAPPIAQPSVTPPQPGPTPDALTTPLAPGQMPPNAPGTPAVPLSPQPPAIPPSPISPQQLQATGAMQATAPVNRVVNNLVSGAPAATAGITRDQIGELYRNPLTRPLATTFLQNQMTPGTWQVQKTEDGRVIAVNTKTLESRDVTPPSPSGQPPMSKTQREYADYVDVGMNQLGMTKEQAQAFAANKGKTPRQEPLSQGAQKLLDTHSEAERASNNTIENLTKMRDMAQKGDIYEGGGAQGRADFMTSVSPWIPGGLPGEQRAENTEQFQNLATQNVAQLNRSTFPGRTLKSELDLMKQIESTPNMPNTQKVAILNQLIGRMKNNASDAAAIQDGIRDGSYFQPGFRLPAHQGDETTQPPATPTTPPAAKPTLKEFIEKSRAVNPGVSTTDLAKYWKKEYGGG